jgi:hypothetical protein
MMERHSDLFAMRMYSTIDHFSEAYQTRVSVHDDDSVLPDDYHIDLLTARYPPASSGMHNCFGRLAQAGTKVWIIIHSDEISDGDSFRSSNAAVLPGVVSRFGKPDARDHKKHGGIFGYDVYSGEHASFWVQSEWYPTSWDSGMQYTPTPKRKSSTEHTHYRREVSFFR